MTEQERIINVKKELARLKRNLKRAEKPPLKPRSYKRERDNAILRLRLSTQIAIIYAIEVGIKQS